MSIGKFNETHESDNEVKETNETTDNAEKSSGKIRESSDSYDDSFDKKLDALESKESSGDSTAEKDSAENKGEKKMNFLDKMRSLFSRKENGGENEKNDKTDDGGDEASRDKGENRSSEARNSFIESLKVEPTSPEKAAEFAKKWREKSGASAEGTNESSGRGIEHGEDGERTRWSDAQWARDHGRE